MLKVSRLAATSLGAIATPGNLSVLRQSIFHSTFLIAKTLHRYPLRSFRAMDISPRWSDGSDVSELEPQLKKLLRSWTLTATGDGITRSFRFKTFKAAWSFMDAVAGECKRSRHHPEWSNVYNRVFVRWTTHSPKGLSEKDLKMAIICDIKAGEFEEVGKEQEEADEVGQELANSVAAEAGDCCKPKKS